MSPAPRLLALGRIAAVGTALAASGCASDAATRPQQGPTAPVPERWGDWTLFEIDGQLVYAADADDAEAAVSLRAEADQAFRERTGREPGARLLLVADASSWMPGGDPCRRLELAEQALAALRGPDAANEDRGLPQSCEALRAEAAEIQVEPAVMVGLIAHPVLPARLPELGVPAAGAAPWPLDWVVLLPTEDALDEGFGALLDAGMENELSMAERLLVAPLMPLALGRVVDGLLAKQQVLLFELEAASQADWPLEERARLTEEFEEELEGEDREDSDAGDGLRGLAPADAAPEPAPDS